MKPKIDNICDICNVELTSRDDDNEESFNKRFDIYLNNVKDVLEYYNDKKALYVVEAHESKMDTLAVIKGILGK